MQKQIEFKYFPEYQKWARFANQECFCQNDLPCLEAVYFENPAIENPVCLDLLVSGQARVEVPDYLKKQLLNSILETHPDWSAIQSQELATQIVDALSRTPPIPWIQHNSWPVCCGDFCCYLGEWDHEQLTEASPDGDGISFLWTILDDSYIGRRNSPHHLWQEIKNGWTIIYVFQCFACKKLIALDQSY